MNAETITVRQLLAGIPASYLEEIADQTQADLYQKKLPARDLFFLLLYGLLEATPLSWRVLEEHFRSPFFQKGIKPQASSIDHSSLNERLEKIPLAYLETLFAYCFSLFARHYQPRDYKRFNLIRFDSTMVSLSARLLSIGLEGGGCPPTKTRPKRAIKYSIGFNGTFAVKARAYFTNSYHSEDVALSELIHQTEFDPTEVAVFDRGLTGKKRLAGLSLANIRFVTRINPTNQVARCSSLPLSTPVGAEDQTIVVLEDALVHCFDEKGKRVETPFRLVVCGQKSTGDTLCFLTNMLEVNALEVAQIYRLRWEIEVFFKFLKQHLSFSHLLSRQGHGLQVMLYMSLIGASLVYVYRKLNRIEGFKIAKLRFMSELQMEFLRIMWASGSVSELFARDNLAGP